MASLRVQAEYLRLALAMSLLEKDAAVSWADRTILGSKDPPIEVIEVSLATNKPSDEMMDLLAVVPGEGDLTAAAHQVLALLRKRLAVGEVTLEAAVVMLEVYSQLAIVPEEELLRAANFGEYLYLAQERYSGSREGVGNEVLNFLAQQTSGPFSAFDESTDVNPFD
jgi:hypothetical protein